MNFITVYTDASFCDTTKKGGWGAYIRHDCGMFEMSGGLPTVNNCTEAEFKAAINGLHCISRLIPSDPVIIVLVTDCASVHLVLNSIILNEGVSYKRKRNLDHALGVFREWLKKLPVTARVKVNKVKAHTGGSDPRSYANKRADKLARTEMKLLRSHALELSREKRDESGNN